MLFELSKNARITTKELGKRTRRSQQSASYAVRRLVQGKLIHFYKSIIDPARFGYLSVVVVYQFTQFKQDSMARATSVLKGDPYVVRLEHMTHGADLLAEYTVPNLSFFNKRHSDILAAIGMHVRIDDIYAVIVRRIYDLKYLHPRGSSSQVIVSGDREPISLPKTQLEVLKELHDSPRVQVTRIASKLGVDAKTVIRAKKELEKEEVLRKYTIVLDHDRTGVFRKYLFVKLEHEENQMDSFIEMARHHRNIVEIAKVLGKFDLLLTVEYLKPDKQIINDLRREFMIVDYRILDCTSVIKSVSVPPAVFE